MAKIKEHTKFGEVFASNVSLEDANKARSLIRNKTRGFCIFVFKSGELYSVGVQNKDGGPLSCFERKQVKEAFKEDS